MPETSLSRSTRPSRVVQGLGWCWPSRLRKHIEDQYNLLTVQTDKVDARPNYVCRCRTNSLSRTVQKPRKLVSRLSQTHGADQQPCAGSTCAKYIYFRGLLVPQNSAAATAKPIVHLEEQSSPII